MQPARMAHLDSYTLIVLNAQVVIQNGIITVLEGLVRVSRAITHQNTRQGENNDIHR